MAINLNFYFKLEELMENFPTLKENIAQNPNVSRVKFSAKADETFSYDYVFPVLNEEVPPIDLHPSEVKGQFRFHRATIQLDQLLEALAEFSRDRVIGILYKNDMFPLDDLKWRNLLLDVLLYPEVIPNGQFDITIVVSDKLDYSLWNDDIPKSAYTLLRLLEYNKRPIRVQGMVSYTIDLVSQHIDKKQDNVSSVDATYLVVVAPVSVFSGQILPIVNVGFVNTNLKRPYGDLSVHPNIGGFVCFGSHTPSYRNLPILTVANYSSAFHSNFSLTAQYIQQIALQMLLEE